MAFFLTLGFKKYDAPGPIEVIYAGASGDEEARALAAVAPGKYVRAERFINPRGIPARLPAAPQAKSASQAPAKPVDQPKPVSTKAKL